MQNIYIPMKNYKIYKKYFPFQIIIMNINQDENSNQAKNDYSQNKLSQRNLGQISQIQFQQEQQDGQRRRNYGSMIPFCYNQVGQPKYFLGPHYYVFIITLLLTSWFLVYQIKNFYNQFQMGIFPITICIFTASLYVFSYIKVAISNPGIASVNMNLSLQDQLDPKYCKQCKFIKIGKIKHCNSCNVCIYQMDHHCPWVGKCIGRDNMKNFQVFLSSITLILIVFSFFIYYYGGQKVPKIY